MAIAAAAVGAAMAAAVSAAAMAEAAPAAEAGIGGSYTISREGGRNFSRNRVHHQRATASFATWAAAAAVATETWAEFTTIAEALAGPNVHKRLGSTPLDQHSDNCKQTNLRKNTWSTRPDEHKDNCKQT